MMEDYLKVEHFIIDLSEKYVVFLTSNKDRARYINPFILHPISTHARHRLKCAF